MTDAEYEAEKARVQGFFETWRTRLGLDDQTSFWCDWQRERSENDTGTRRGIGPAAATEAEWQYKHAAFTWYLPRLADCVDSVVETTVVHELVHYLTNCVDKFVAPKDIERLEFMTESVTQAILSVWRAAREYEPVTGEY